MVMVMARMIALNTVNLELCLRDPNIGISGTKTLRLSESLSGIEKVRLVEQSHSTQNAIIKSYTSGKIEGGHTLFLSTLKAQHRLVQYNDSHLRGPLHKAES